MMASILLIDFNSQTMSYVISKYIDFKDIFHSNRFIAKAMAILSP